MTTASDILTRAARSLGYLGRTEVMSAADINDALLTFNTMLDSWSNEKLMSYITLERTFTLIIGQQQYTIGPGGNFNTARPFDITQAFITDSNQLRYPVTILPQDKWNLIGELNINSQIPTTLFYDPQYPLGVINIFPVPLVGYTLTIDSTQAQVDFTSLTQSLSMPLGYERMMISNLAIELMGAGWPCLLNQLQLAALMKQAEESKANVKRTNIKEVIADYDQAIVSKSYATYNIYSDGNPRG